MDAISLQEVALTMLKNLGFSSRSARDRGGEPANHSEATTFDLSPGTFKPRKFAKTDVVTGNEAPEEQELDPRNINVRATSCHEMASMNA
ncbi:hypothetical protein E2C01_074540 [Portunus trituberculatus]|uniref:Uncharacterized protein n=1 Tax=Portunus trituberculatus TaxID=210409 RepID=A0A5B7I5X1_PORTR|nr:hypothetical protein [Portunus trituberculatus]